MINNLVAIMEIKVKLSNLRTSPKKVRKVVDLVRGKEVLEAQSILLFTTNKSARPVLKLLNSAVASAEHEFQLDRSKLFVSKITVDEGPKLKRWHAMSRGRAYPIIKRSSFIELTLGETNQTNIKKPTKKSPLTPSKAKKLKEQKDIEGTLKNKNSKKAKP